MANGMTSGMRSVVVDKVASVTQACGLSHEVRVSADIPAEEGVVVAVEVLTNKSTYNTLELTSGRMAKVQKGDVVVGALGHRKALFGYSILYLFVLFAMLLVDHVLFSNMWFSSWGQIVAAR